jgi:7-cyano-7-deazaguanine reductase
MSKVDNKTVSKHLGQTSEYKTTYDPSLLVREPRQSNRTHLGIKDNDLPFHGNDTWNAYEISALTNNGLPVVGIAKIVYPCDSEYIVESKSIKLYFNSFNMTKLGDTAEDVLDQIGKMAAGDLSALLETKVLVRVHSNARALGEINIFTAKEEWMHSENCTPNYITLEDEYPVKDIKFSVYTETPELLEEIEDAPSEEVYYHSALLKSNCRVTSQPDWGDVYIYIKGKNTVDPISLLQYIVSFRDECHFHEEICEAIYKRIMDTIGPDELSVRCLYARRGGIDINPERASHTKLLHHTLSEVGVPHIKTPKQ